jgi:DNA-binding CsgD family transcriptional regulator
VDTLRKVIRLKQPFHELLGIGCAIEFIGWCAVTDGNAEDGTRLLGAATTFLKPLGLDFDTFFHRTRDDRRDHVVIAGKARTALGDAGYERAHQQGADLTQDEAVALALGQSPRHLAEEQRPVLTRREEQIAALLADGLSNKDIADHLTISQRTAETHVANILTKLSCTSRAQVAVWMTEHRARHAD